MKRLLLQALEPRPPAHRAGAGSDPSTWTALRATVEALLEGFAAESEPYMDLLRLEAARVPGNAVLQERFARAADRAAFAAGGKRFAETPPALRRAIIERLARTRGMGPLPRRLRALLLQRRRWAYETAIVRPVLTHFAGTDAHVAAGYRWPPGAPRPWPIDEQALGATA